jgi:acyl-coenzyme A thioesterase PaaI-like protein
LTSTDPLGVRAWFPIDDPPSERRLRKHALAEDVRRLVADVLYLDVEGADADALAEAERVLAAARTAVAALPDIRGSGGVYGNRGDASLFERSPFSGRCNALAAPLTVTFDGDRTLAHATYGEAYEGPPGSVHGGHVVAAFDDILGVAQAASGTAGFTGTLSVRLAARTPLHERIDYEAGVLSHDGRKVTAWGRSTARGELLAEATGVFIAPRGGLDLPDRDGAR